jgi:hypothetical protein
MNTNYEASYFDIYGFSGSITGEILVTEGTGLPKW